MRALSFALLALLAACGTHEVGENDSALFPIPIGRTPSGWSSWTNLGKANWKRPALIAPTAGRVLAFAEGDQLELTHRTLENGSWSAWKTTMRQANPPIVGQIRGAPVPVKMQGTRMGVFARMVDDSIAYTGSSDDGVTFQPWDNLK